MGTDRNGTHFTVTSAGVTPTMTGPCLMLAPGGSLSIRTVCAHPVNPHATTAIIRFIAMSRLYPEALPDTLSAMSLLFAIVLAVSAPAAVAAPASDASVKSAKMSKAQRRKQSKAEARELELLQRSATLYWEGVRWNDSEKASKFIEDPGARLEFQAWLDERGEERKIIDVKIIGLSVQASPENATGISRTAELRVATEGYTVPEQVLKKATENQQWYRTVNGWWVRWTPPSTIPAEAPTAE